MNIKELTEKRNTLKSDIDNIIKKGEVEQRRLTADELATIEARKAEINKINEQIEKLSINLKINDGMEEKRFSLVKTIRDIVDGRGVPEEAKAVIAEGQEQFKRSGVSYKGQIVLPVEHRAAIASTSSGSGAEAVATNKMNILEPLFANLVLAKAGATIMTGLIGNVSIPVYAGSTVGWVGETGSASDAAGATSSVELSPKRIAGYIDVSKMFLNQDSVNAEQMLMNEIVTQVQEALEAAVFTKTTANAPNGIFYGIDATNNFTNYGSASFAKVAGLVKALYANKALRGNLAFIAEPEVWNLLTTTPKAANQAIFINENDRVLGYPLLVSQNISKITISTVDYYPLTFANWADLVIGQWGGVDLTIDPYSQAVNGKVRIIVNAYFDFKKKRDASFAIGGVTLT